MTETDSFFQAVQEGDAAGVSRILEDDVAHGSDRAARPHAGQTAADVARQRGEIVIAEVLVG